MKKLSKVLILLSLVFGFTVAPTAANADFVEPLIMEYTVPAGGQIRLPFGFVGSETPDVTIDWGDGSPTETVNSRYVVKAHTYVEAGVYNVSILGRFEYFNTSDHCNNYNPKLQSQLTGIVQFGDGIMTLSNLASHAPNLEYVPDVLPERFTDISWMFYCSAVPENILNWDTSNIKNMAAMFTLSDFDMDISEWDFSAIDLTPGMAFDSFGWLGSNNQWSLINYSKFLLSVGDTATASGLNLDGSAFGYCDWAAEARQALVAEKSWNISDGGQKVCEPLALVPDQPAAPTVEAGDRSITITVTHASSGVQPTGYRAYIDENNYCEITYPETSCVISGLQNGNSYTAYVIAYNEEGDSDPSDLSNAVTPFTTEPTYIREVRTVRIFFGERMAKLTDWNRRKLKSFVDKLPKNANVQRVVITATTQSGSTYSARLLEARAKNVLGNIRKFGLKSKAELRYRGEGVSISPRARQTTVRVTILIPQEN